MDEQSDKASEHVNREWPPPRLDEMQHQPILTLKRQPRRRG